MDNNDIEDTYDKMSSLIDEGSLSSSSPPPIENNKPLDIIPTKKAIGRIRTAVGKSIVFKSVTYPKL